MSVFANSWFSENDLCSSHFDNKPWKQFLHKGFLRSDVSFKYQMRSFLLRKVSFYYNPINLMSRKSCIQNSVHRGNSR